MDRRDLLKLFALSPLAPAAVKAAVDQPETSTRRWRAVRQTSGSDLAIVSFVVGLESNDPQLPILDKSYTPIGHVRLEPDGINPVMTSTSIQIKGVTRVACRGCEFDLFSWMPFSGSRYITIAELAYHRDKGET